MTSLAELRALLAKANASLDGVRGTEQFTDAFLERENAYERLKSKTTKALPSLLDVAEAAEEIFGHLVSSTDLNTDYEINPPLYRLMRALGKLGVGTDGIMRSDK